MLRGRPFYSVRDHAFDFEVVPSKEIKSITEEGSTSFVIDTLQLEVAIGSLLCLYVWGYSPVNGWTCTTLSKPTVLPGSLTALCPEPLVRGVSIGLEDSMHSTSWFDPKSGWFCIGEREHDRNAKGVEFATDSIAMTCHGRLSSLWVRPDNWRDLCN